MAVLHPLKRLGEFSLMDLESVWLILQGSSVIDWHRLNFTEPWEAEGFVAGQGFSLTDRSDRQRLEAIRDSAIDYLRRNFEFPIPGPVARASVPELLLLASGKGHRQLCACTILKAMHIIHHVEARELLFTLPMSDQDVFRLIEDRVYRLVGHMLSDGLPILEFVGGRKRRDAIYTKLMSKRDAHSSAVYDKLRFRIVTRSKDDVLPVLLYLTHHLFPFNYVVANESINTIIPFRSYVQSHPHLAELAPQLHDPPADALTLGDNVFSAESYRIFHFVVDLPLRTPPAVLAAAPPEVRAFGPIIFGLCEFQMVDQRTEESNELGEASHASYKERQRLAVMRRLKLGAAGKRAEPDRVVASVRKEKEAPAQKPRQPRRSRKTS